MKAYRLGSDTEPNNDQHPRDGDGRQTDEMLKHNGEQQDGSENEKRMDGSHC